MPGELERIAQITDPFELLRAATQRLAEAQLEVTELGRLRRRLIQDLHAQGMSYAQIAQAAGLSRGRIHQIRHTGPAPEGAFLGSAAVIVITPLRPAPAGDRTYVALDDLNAGKRLEELARSFDLAATSDHVQVSGEVDLNRDGLLVICGPRMSEVMRTAYARDPVISWDHDSAGWLLRDERTGNAYRSGQEDSPARPYDVGYLGRLPRPDGNGSFLAMAGLHPEGSLGVVQLLTTDIGTLWGQVGTAPFSVVVGTEYDPRTHEPVRTELLTPLYRHDA
jgi:hypothetical protein